MVPLKKRFVIKLSPLPLYTTDGCLQEVKKWKDRSKNSFVSLGKASREAGKHGFLFVFSHGASLIIFVFPNLRLTNQKARGSALDPWAALRAAPTSRNCVSVYDLARTYFINNT